VARRVLLHGRSATFAAFRPTCVLPLNIIRSVCFGACYPVGMAAGLLLAGCSGNAGSESVMAVPPPTGHYEGPISYQGTELRVALELREIRPGQLQAEISFPQLPGLEFEAARTTYQAPQLRLEQESGQPGAVTVQAVREGDFLRGVLSWDTIPADFVWVRRGAAAAPGFREQALNVPGTGRLHLLFPDDTLARHAALLLLTSPATAAAARQRATYLARRGFVTVVVPTASADSVGAQRAAAVLRQVRRHPGIDSARVGYWGRGPVVATVVAAASVPPRPGFVVLEAAPAATRDEAKPYYALQQLRIPALAFYAGLDTTVQAAASARRLRAALGGRRGTQVRIIPQVTAEFSRPGYTRSDGQWQWPQPAPEYWDGLPAWLRQR
jgi:hypothetical protein